MNRIVRNSIQAALRPLGYRIQRIPRQQYAEGVDYDRATVLPQGAAEYLRPENPHLQDLDRRYARVDSPVCQHTQWRPAVAAQYSADVLRYFRGDSAYLWAYRALGDAQRRFYIFGQYLLGLDGQGLLAEKLREDGLFGCFMYRFEKMPTLSRDLLDSVNELYFLDRHLRLLSRKGLRVLDIGAGYGRLAHRMLAASDGVERYWCIDAVARSTFLCDYYLRFRGLAGQPDSRAAIVPLDQMEQAIAPGSVDLAMNIHSFSEMGYEAIEAWVQWLVRLQVPRLFLIPNHEQLLSHEADGSRRDFSDILARAGFRAVAQERTIADPDVRDLVGVYDYFWLFERA